MMSGAEGRKVSKLLELVEKRVEQCLHHYMNKKEVIDALSVCDNVEPFITDLVWQKLEEQNEDFFKVYYLSLLVKDQILEFNRLLSQQVVLMHQSGLTGIGHVLISNESHVSPTQQISSFAAQSIRRLKGDTYNNGGSTIQSYPPGTVDMSLHCRTIDISPSMLSQNFNIGVDQTMKGKTIRTEADYYAGSSPFHYSPPSDFPESSQLIGDACLASSSGVESKGHHINETVLDGDASSFGFLESIPLNFNFPEFSVDFSNLLESYNGQSYVATDANNTGDPHGVLQRFDPASESLRRQHPDGN